NFARQFRIGVGSTLRVPTPAGAFTVPVAGVVVDYVSPRGSIVLSRATYQRWWGDRAVNRFHVTLGPGVDAAAVRRAIAGGVVAEAAGVCLLGLAGAVAMGAALAVLWVRVNFAYQLGWDVDFHFAAESLPAAALAAFLVSVPAGALPARWIARLPVIEALREG